jgi:tetratricopeptide (TPR) repeat protein
MTKSSFEPLANGLFRIVDPSPFEAAWTLAQRHTAEGKFRQACQVRFEACRRLLDLLPDEEADPVPLDFERPENHSPLFLLHGSAIDHFLIGDYELAAALLETLLDLDEEDHLGASQTLAWSYIALNERESFEAVRPDLDDKSPEKALAAIWAELRFDDRVPVERIAEFKKNFPAVFREFTAPDHPADEAWLADIDGAHPSPEARARRLWLQTEPLWQQFPELTAALRRYA